jgi:hypothetical protein
VRTGVELAAVTVGSVGVLALLYWLSIRYLRVPREFALAVVLNTTLLWISTDIYRYYLGWIRHRLDHTADTKVRERRFRRVFRIAVFSVLIALPLAFAMVAAFQDMTAAVVLLALALGGAPFVWRRMRAEILDQDPDDPGRE